MARVAGLTVAALLLALPAPATAKTFRQTHQVVAYVPFRIHEQIGFVPIAGISPRPRVGLPRPVRLRYGGDTYIGRWSNFTVTSRNTSEALKYMRRAARGRYGDADRGLFADRPLTRRERRHFKVLVDLARDADVLVVDRGHPACAGLTKAQVTGIASGRITRWSQVVPLPAGQPDEIALRHVQVRDVHEPRFGQGTRPRSARGAFDGGISEASRNAAVAGVTSWSRARGLTSVCTVPIDGIAPSDFSVHALRYGAAYPISFVVVRKRQRIEHSRAVRRAFVAFLRSSRAAELFRNLGLVMAADRPAPAPGGSPQPAPDADAPPSDGRGRPITATRDDQAARAELTGDRLEREDYPHFRRWAFEPNSVLHEVQANQDAGECNVRTGSWTLISGWRYADYGGGVIARLRLDLGSPMDAWVDLPGDDPGGAYVDGLRWMRDRSLPPHC